MKVWAEFRVGNDEKEYGLRYLLTDEEAEHLQKVGCVGTLYEVVSMKSVADSKIAEFERDQVLMDGGVIQ